MANGYELDEQVAPVTQVEHDNRSNKPKLTKLSNKTISVEQVELENRTNEANQPKRSSLDEAVAQIGLERVIGFSTGTPRRKE